MPNVTLEPDVARLIDQQLEAGPYRSASDVVRAGLHLLAQAAERRAELRADLAARATDPAALLPADEVFARLHAHHAAQSRRGA